MADWKRATTSLGKWLPAGGTKTWSCYQKRDNQGTRRRVGELAQLVKCLPWKHKGLRSPEHVWKKSGAVVHTRGPHAGEARTGTSLGFTDQPAKPTWQVSSQGETLSPKSR